MKRPPKDKNKCQEKNKSSVKQISSHLISRKSNNKKNKTIIDYIKTVIPVKETKYNNITKRKKKSNQKKEKYKKKKIPLAVKQNVWVKRFGKVYEHKCYVSWCHRMVTCFDFEVGHNIPESKGGTLDLHNLMPICRQCNIGMGNRYTIDEWSDKHFFH